MSVGEPPLIPDENAGETYFTGLFNLAMAGVFGYQLYGVFRTPCGAYDAALG